MRALALAVLLLVTGCESIKGYIEDRAIAESTQGSEFAVR